MARGESAGSAVVDLLVSTAEADRSIEAWARRARSVTVTLTADSAPADRAVSDLASKARSQAAAVPVDADTTAYRAKLDELAKLRQQTQRYQVDLDLTRARAELAKWDADSGKAMTAMHEKLQRLNEIQLRSKQLRLDVDVAQAEAALKKMGDEAEQQLAAKLDKISSKMSSIGRTASVAVTAPISAAFGLALKSASDLGERVNATNVLFGEGAQVVHDYAASAAMAFGQSKLEAEEMAGGFANLLRMAGVSQQELSEMSVSLAKRAADIGSFLNKSNQEVTIALQSGLAGESESVRRLGVAVNEYTVKQTAWKMGIAEVGKELNYQQKVLATYYAIMQQTNVMAGDFGNTLGNSMPNQMKASKAELANISSEIGEKLIPFMRFGLVGARDFLRAFAGWSDGAQTAAMGIAALLAAAGPLLIFTSKAVSSIGYLHHALTATDTILRTSTGALTGFGKAMAGLSIATAVVGGLLALKSIFDGIEKSHAEKKIQEITDALKDYGSAKFADQVQKDADALGKLSAVGFDKIGVKFEYDPKSKSEVDKAFEDFIKRARDASGAISFLADKASTPIGDKAGLREQAEGLREVADRYGNIKKVLDGLISEKQIETARAYINALEGTGQVDPQIIKLFRDEIEATQRAEADAQNQTAQYNKEVDVFAAGQSAAAGAASQLTSAAKEQAGAMGTAADAIKSWGEVAEAAFSAQFSLPKLNADSIVALDAWNKRMVDYKANLVGGSKYESQLSDLRAKATSATKARTDAEAALNQESGESGRRSRQLASAEKELAELRQKAADAAKGESEAARAVTSAQHDVESADRAVAKAEADVEQAKRDHEAAQADLAKAEADYERILTTNTQKLQGYGAASKEAATSARELASAELDLQSAHLAVADAADRVAAAQDNVNNGFQRAQAAAEAKAKQEIADADADVAQAEDNLANARKRAQSATANIATAEKGVETARQNAAKAAKAVTTAEENEAKARQQAAKAAEDVAKAEAHAEQVLKGYGAASKEGVKATRELAAAQRAAQSAALDIADAQDALAEAEAKLAAGGVDPNAAAQEAQRFAEFQKKKADAQRQLIEAEKQGQVAAKNLATVEREVNLVLSGYAANTREAITATRDLARAQRAGQSAQLDLLDSQDALAEAQARYNSLGADTSAAEREKAFRQLQRAQLALAEAQDKAVTSQEAAADQAAKTDEVLNGAKEGSAAYAAAMEKLAQAQAQVVSASEAIATAQAAANETYSPETTTNVFNRAEAEREVERARIALAAANEAQIQASEDLAAQEEETDGIINGAKEGSDAYKEATDAVTAAKENLKEATDNVTAAEEATAEARQNAQDATDAIAVAEQAVVEAREEAAAAANDVTKAENDLAAAQAKRASAGVVQNDFDEEKAKRELEKATIDLEQAKLREKAATDEVTAKQKAYNEVVYGVPPDSEEGRKLRQEIADADAARVTAREKVNSFEGELGKIQDAVLAKDEAIRSKLEAQRSLAEAQKKKRDELPALLDQIKDKEQDIKDIQADALKATADHKSKVEALTKARQDEATAASAVKKFIDEASDATKNASTQAGLVSDAWSEIERRVNQAAATAKANGDTTFNELTAYQKAAAAVSGDLYAQGLTDIGKMIDGAASQWKTKADIQATIHGDPKDIQNAADNMARNWAMAAAADHNKTAFEKPYKDLVAGLAKGDSLQSLMPKLQLLADTEKGKALTDGLTGIINGAKDLVKDPLHLVMDMDPLPAQGSLRALEHDVEERWEQRKAVAKLTADITAAKKSVDDASKHVEDKWTDGGGVGGGGRNGFAVPITADRSSAKKTVEDAAAHAKSKWTDEKKQGALTGVWDAAKKTVEDAAAHAKTAWTDMVKEGKLTADRTPAKNTVEDARDHATTEWTTKKKEGSLTADRNPAKNTVEDARDHANTEWTTKKKEGSLTADRSSAKGTVEDARDHANTEWTTKQKEGKLTADRSNATTETNAADQLARQVWHSIQYTGLLRGKNDEPNVGAVPQSQEAKREAENYSGTNNTKVYSSTLKADDQASGPGKPIEAVKSAVASIPGEKATTLKATPVANSGGELPVAAASAVSGALSGIKDRDVTIKATTSDIRAKASGLQQYMEELWNWWLFWAQWGSQHPNQYPTGVVGPAKPNPSDPRFGMTAAEGALLYGPTQVLAGEAGAELILPLTKPDAAARLLGRAAEEFPEAVRKALLAAGLPRVDIEPLLHRLRERYRRRPQLDPSVLGSLNAAATAAATAWTPPPAAPYVEPVGNRRLPWLDPELLLERERDRRREREGLTPEAKTKVDQLHIHTQLTDVGQVADVVMERLERPLVGLMGG